MLLSKLVLCSFFLSWLAHIPSPSPRSHSRSTQHHAFSGNVEQNSGSRGTSHAPHAGVQARVQGPGDHFAERSTAIARQQPWPAPTSR